MKSCFLHTSVAHPAMSITSKSVSVDNPPDDDQVQSDSEAINRTQVNDKSDEIVEPESKLDQ